MALSFGSNQKASLEAYQVQLQKNKDLFTAYDAVTKEYCDFKVLQAKNEVLGGASSAYDTLKEIENYLGSNDSLSSALLSSIQNTATALATEKARAESAEATLSLRILDEQKAREMSDNTLNVSISTLQTADNMLSVRVDDEKKERQSEDLLLDGKISAEVVRAFASEQQLRTDLTTESTERKAEDTRIFNALLQSGQRLGEKDAEILNEVWSIQGQLQMADNALGSRIDTEKARAEASEALKFDKSGGAISGSVTLNLSESTNTYLNLSPVWRVVCSNSGDRVQFEFLKDGQWTIALPFIMSNT